MKSKKNIIQEFFQATNDRDWEKVSQLVHAKFVRHSSSPPVEIATKEGLIAFHKAELETFPDLHERVVFAIEEGDLVAVRINFSGTQLGKLGKFPPSGRTLNADYNCFFRVSKQKIIEAWVEYDNLNGLIQLGHYTLNENAR